MLYVLFCSSYSQTSKLLQTPPTSGLQIPPTFHLSLFTMSTSSSSSKWNCRSCGQRRINTWCMNTQCDEYVGPLKSCGVKGCDFPTPHVLCRVHYTKGDHCANCARKVNHEGFCLKCDSLVECVIDDCKDHALWVDDSTIPLCRQHFGTRICFEHLKALDGGVCSLCSDSVSCTVDGCDHPTVKGRPLCVSHHKEGLHCGNERCGEALWGLDEAIAFCPHCDETWHCKTKGCLKIIAQYNYCKACHKERTAYVV